MKKYFKFLPILGLVLFVVMHMIYARPRTVENILGISSNTVFNFCNVQLTDWNGAILDSKNAELTQLEFNHVIEMMSASKYCKTWGKNDYTSDDGSYYDFTLSYFMSWSKKRQRITITKDGYVYINDYWYHVSSGEDKEMLHSIYEYICQLIEENTD